MIIPGTTPVIFKLNETNKNKILSLKTQWNFQGLSEFTYYRTYSRLKENGKMESWTECVIRVIEGMFTVLKTHAKRSGLPWDERRGQRLATEAAERMHCFKWLPPGRGLWMMGTDFIWEKGGIALNNCAFVSTKDFDKEEDIARPFCFLMDVSMLGVGCGFDTKGADSKYEVVGYSEEVVTFIVQDTREGWVNIVDAVISNGLQGGPDIKPDTSLVRPEGTPIRGFGGVASGPLPLIQGIDGIKDILNKRAKSKNKYFSSTDIVDIMNIIGKIVVAGNVRRCLPENTFVQMSDGSKKRIQDIEINDFVVFNGNDSKVTNWFNQGKQEIYSIVLEEGELESTKEHRWLVYCHDTHKTGWVHTSDMATGNYSVLTPK